MPRTAMHCLLLLAALLPVLLVLSLWSSCRVWRDAHELVAENAALHDRLTLAEAAASRADALQALEQPPPESVQRHLAAARLSQDAPVAATPPSPADADGPGHEEFPATESGVLTLRNVNARGLDGQRLRVSMDICNLEGKAVISGRVDCHLLTENGSVVALAVRPETVTTFRITRLKKAVFVGSVPPQHNLGNGQLLVAVYNDNNELLYRNIYAVAR